MEALESQIGVRSESQLHSSVHDSQRSFMSLDIPEHEYRASSPPGTAEGTKDQPIAIPDESDISQSIPPAEGSRSGKRDFDTFNESQGSRVSRESERVSWARREAYEAMMRNVLGRGEGGWEGIALISTGGHSGAEDELGEGTDG